MGGTQRRSRVHHKQRRDICRNARTRHYRRDHDQILNDLLPENTEKLSNRKPDIDLPGAGQHYCISCAKYLISAEALQTHLKTKKHLRRYKQIVTEKPFSQSEAEAAAGMSTPDNGVKLRNNNNNNIISS